MGVVVKEIKNRMIEVPLLDLMEIKGMLNLFRIETRGDMARLNEIDQVCDSAEKSRLGIIEMFKTDNNLPADTTIDDRHKLFNELYQKIISGKVNINESSLARFTENELDYATSGGKFTFGGLKLLEKYLVKK